MNKIAIISLLLAATAQAAPVTVIGLPLGGKLGRNPPQCPFSSESTKTICWISTPFTHKDGSRSGYAQLPNPDSRVDWAAHAMFQIHIKKDLTLYGVKISTEMTPSKKIAKSLSLRFGPPISAMPPNYRWISNEIIASLVCTPDDRCWTEFSLPSSDAAKSSTPEQKRPATP